MRRPASYDPSMDSAILIGIGSAHAVASPDPEVAQPAGVIWVPDIDAHHKWREYLIPREAKPGARPRRIGFGKP